jgi:phage anti-repressor protein
VRKVGEAQKAYAETIQTSKELAMIRRNKRQ